MTHDLHGTPVQRSLAEMLSSYLTHRAGMRITSADDVGDVVPFETAAVQPVNPRLAWDEAKFAAAHYHPGCDSKSWKTPPEWATLVATHEPVMALPLCLGNYPQLVRDLHTLMQATEFSSLRPIPSRPASVSSLVASARDALKHGDYARFLFTVGMFRLARQFEQAEELLHDHERELPTKWQAAAANERAALAWHQGNARAAQDLWAAQEPTVPVLFNRGMSALFSDNVGEARTALAEAIAQLPEENAWHQLGRFYQTLALARG